MVISSGYRL